MKKYLILSLFTALSILIVPLCVYGIFSDTSINRIPELHSVPQNIGDISFDTIKVYNSQNERTETLDFREYIIGVVAAEMPVEFHSEALSAGTVTAATLARKKLLSGADEALDGAVISTDSTKHQAYMDKEEMKERWGEDFNEYYEKLCTAVDNAIDYSITYEDELIVSVYHAISPGITENAENVWIGGFPYLVSVDSSGDKLSPKYSSELKLGFEEFHAAMTEQGVTLPEDKTLWFDSGEYTEAGTLKSINIGDKSFSGEELRDIFSLRSNAITLSMNNEGITFSVKGYGHGVGMSQYGADYLARQGYTWQEIIKHYYTGVEIEII
ncbi:MAG: stage II sporulation protein D [Clostridia bacterium]|nr:stage II sporulation protein D [Clostridia bacterium]